MNKAETLLVAFQDLNWENYIEISDAIVEFDKSNVEGELITQASIYSYYQGLLTVAKREYDKAQLDLAQFVATSRKDEQDACLRSGKKTTEKSLEAYVVALPQYKEKTSITIELSYKLGLLKGLVDALQQKKDMLIQLSANARAETKLYS
tara:strand:- start:938 stop:1387 length:450 start_codon:yes stop_codon:yes gene_type:complete